MNDTQNTRLRVGMGFDIHRLTVGRRLILGGVVIPFEKGLDGHSDADVLLHSISDAMLGALALGDLGRHFPDTDPRYEGISSLTLIRLIADLLRSRGYRVDSVDANVIADEPKLAPHIEKMRLKIARALEVDLDSVSVKAKTHEGLGPLGNGDAIASQAVCVLTPLEARSQASG